MKNFVLVLLLFLCNQTIYSQHYFEGEVHYHNEVIKKDSSFDVTSIISYPSKGSILYFKNGDWMQTPDTGIVEYTYFNHITNRNIYKMRYLDTLLFYNYNKLSADQPPVTSVTVIENADTILGLKCNKVTLETAARKLSFFYNPELKIDPEWFKNTSGGYYNIIYENTKALYLQVIIETDSYISIVKAEKIVKRKLPDNFFPNVSTMPSVELE